MNARCLVRLARNRNFVAQLRGISSSPSVGIIIVGDEILKGQVQDTNSHYMCGLLHEHGVKVKKISVVSDDVEEIGEEIGKFSKRFTYVVTAGGIGPTHDDVTYEGLAKAFGDSLHFHPKLVDLVKKFISKDSSSPNKMAQIPTRASLKFGTSENPLVYPYVSLENVFVFPGSPMFLERSFRGLCKELFAENRKFAKDELYLNAREESFADILTAVSKEFPDVSFGSYPVNHRYYKVRVTIESNDAAVTERAKQRFTNSIPSNIIVQYDREPHIDSAEKYRRSLGKIEHRETYNRTLEELKDIYRKPSSAAIYLDGRIESVIILHLSCVLGEKLRAVYFKHGVFAKETERFVHEIAGRYNVSLITLGGDVHFTANALKSLRPELRTLLIGLRSDKDRKELFHELGDGNAIDKLEIHSPLTEWTDECVWTFAETLHLPYCTVYDN